MAGYIGSKASVVTPGAERKKVFAITSTTTSMTGLSYSPGFVHVFHNGVRLVDGTDYTATNGTSITLTNAALNGDEVVVISYATYQNVDSYTKAEADGRYVNVTGDTMTGALNLGDGRTYFGKDGGNFHWFAALDIASEPARLGYGFGSNGSNVTDHRFYTNGLQRLAIDTDGRVTMPGQPIFMGIPTTDYGSGGYTAGVMDITAIYDNGSNFNAANSRFTAPVNGWYRVTWGGLQLNQTVTSLMVNGVRTHNGNHVVFTGSYATLTQTVYRYLSAGDYLNIEAWNSGGWYKDWWIWTVDLTA